MKAKRNRPIRSVLAVTIASMTALSCAPIVIGIGSSNLALEPLVSAPANSGPVNEILVVARQSPGVDLSRRPYTTPYTSERLGEIAAKIAEKLEASGRYPRVRWTVDQLILPGEKADLIVKFELWGLSRTGVDPRMSIVVRDTRMQRDVGAALLRFILIHGVYSVSRAVDDIAETSAAYILDFGSGA